MIGALSELKLGSAFPMGSNPHAWLMIREAWLLSDSHCSSNASISLPEVVGVCEVVDCGGSPRSVSCLSFCISDREPRSREASYLTLGKLVSLNFPPPFIRKAMERRSLASF